MSELVSQSEFARRIGVSQPMVNKGIRSGRIQKTASGKIDWASQSIAWEANRRVEKDHRSRGIGAGGNQAKDGTYQKLLAANKQMDYKLKELKLRELEGEVISKENLQKRYAPKLTLIKTHMMSIPARHAHTLAAILIRHVEKISKAKPVRRALSRVDERQLARDISEVLDSDIRRLLKEIAAVENF